MGGLGQISGMLILGGWGQKWVCPYYGGGCFGTDIGDVNILGGRGALGRDWGC